jgi:DNA-binding NtrC family response regulator
MQDEKIKNPSAPILFVDDDQMIHSYFELHFPDWHVLFAYSAEEALEILDRERIVIVITDIVMPGISGLELLKAIKTKYQNRVQVIMMTGADEIDNLKQAFVDGATDFVVKPLGRDDIEEALTLTLRKIKRWEKAFQKISQKQSE